jgi:hypothetical protein
MAQKWPFFTAAAAASAFCRAFRAFAFIRFF